MLLWHQSERSLTKPRVSPPSLPRRHVLIPQPSLLQPVIQLFLRNVFFKAGSLILLSVFTSIYAVFVVLFSRYKRTAEAGSSAPAISLICPPRRPSS